MFDAAFEKFSDALCSRPDMPELITEGMELFAAVPEQHSTVLYLSDESDHSLYPAASSPQLNHKEAMELLGLLSAHDSLDDALRQTHPALLTLTGNSGKYEAIVLIPLVSPDGIAGVIALCYPDASRSPLPRRSGRRPRRGLRWGRARRRR